MIGSWDGRRTSTGGAVLAGAIAGLAAVCLYLGVGLLIADWSLEAFLAQLSASTVGEFAAMTLLVVAFVGLPVAGLLRFHLLTPLVVLVFLVLGWLTVGAVQGLLSLQTIFGLALYAAYFSPVALVLYAVVGGGEYLFRTRTQSL